MSGVQDIVDLRKASISAALELDNFAQSIPVRFTHLEQVTLFLRAMSWDLGALKREVERAQGCPVLPWQVFVLLGSYPGLKWAELPRFLHKMIEDMDQAQGGTLSKPEALALRDRLVELNDTCDKVINYDFVNGAAGSHWIN